MRRPSRFIRSSVTFPRSLGTRFGIQRRDRPCGASDKQAAHHDQARQTVPLSRSKRRSSGRTNAPCLIAGARHSLSPHHRSRTGKATNHRQRTDRSSVGRTPHRPAAQVSPVGTATHDAAHGSRNPAFGRPLPPPTRQSRGRRTGTARATRRRRDIEARQDRRRRDQRHRDSAEKAIQAATGDGYAGSQKVNGIRHPTLKAQLPAFDCGRGSGRRGQSGPIVSMSRRLVMRSACAIRHLVHMPMIIRGRPLR